MSIGNLGPIILQGASTLAAQKTRLAELERQIYEAKIERLARSVNQQKMIREQKKATHQQKKAQSTQAAAAAGSIILGGLLGAGAGAAGAGAGPAAGTHLGAQAAAEGATLAEAASGFTAGTAGLTDVVGALAIPGQLALNPALVSGPVAGGIWGGLSLGDLSRIMMMNGLNSFPGSFR